MHFQSQTVKFCGRLIIPKKIVNFNISAQRNVHIIRTIKEMREYRQELFKIDSKVGFVPTMGALHSGHISLVQKASQFNDITIVSIFVNPSQFSKGEDLDKYPRQLEADIELLKQVKMDCIFAPLKNEIYPPNAQALCHVEPTDFSSIFEGQARPDFFRGVATIVCKLFNIIQPSRAYFGQKDISQCILIRKMVQDLNINTEIKVCETIRESDGLAMSSRNVYLSKEERKVSNIIIKALKAVKIICEERGKDLTRSQILSTAEYILLYEPLVTKIEYISFASHVNMKELEVYEKGAVISTAVRIGKVRLIDNLLIGEAHREIVDAN